jgi:hypothetical protein
MRVLTTARVHASACMCSPRRHALRQPQVSLFLSQLDQMYSQLQMLRAEEYRVVNYTDMLLRPERCAEVHLSASECHGVPLSASDGL